jgi:hypothetical protein
MMMMLLDGNWVDMCDAGMHVHAGHVTVMVGGLRGVVVVVWEIHLQVFCLARGRIDV